MATVVGTAQETTALVVLVELRNHMSILQLYAKDTPGLKVAANASSKMKVEEMPMLRATIPTEPLMWECSKLTRLTGVHAVVEIPHAT